MCRSCREDEMQLDYSCLREILEYVETNSDGFITDCGVDRNRGRNFQPLRLRQGTINFTAGCSEAAAPLSVVPNRRFRHTPVLSRAPGAGHLHAPPDAHEGSQGLLSTSWQKTSNASKDTTNASRARMRIRCAKPATHRHAVVMVRKTREVIGLGVEA